MSICKMTIFGLENFMRNQNDSMFAELVLPEGVVLNDLIDNILLKGGEFGSLYTDPFFIKEKLKTWSRAHLRTFARWKTALDTQYNGLDNYDRIEEWSNTQGGTVGTSGTSEAIDKVSPYDSGGFVNKAQATTTGSSTNTINTNDSHSGRVHGNIGVMSTQRLLGEEVESAKLNLINLITDLFIQDFCVMVYI